VWYTRDEWARDHEVLHPRWGVLDKSGVHASKVLCLTPGGLQDVPVEGVDEIAGHRRETRRQQRQHTSSCRQDTDGEGERSHLTARQQSAAGRVGRKSAEGPNGAPTGAHRRGAVSWGRTRIPPQERRWSGPWGTPQGVQSRWGSWKTTLRSTANDAWHASWRGDTCSERGAKGKAMAVAQASTA